MLNKRLLATLLLSAPLALGATSCSKGSEAGIHTIRILNLEDYIYIDEENRSNDLVHQFEAWANKEFGYNDVKVVYDTSDTNESEYNDLLTGRIAYDLVCTSDYMLQKFVRENLVTTLNKEALENYNTYASPVIKERLDQISVVKDGEEVCLEDYAVGYMWGTLGLLINPEFKDMDFDTTISDAQSWDILWNENYKNTASIKNSMRDTYAVALMHGYNSKLEELKLKYQEDGDAEAYNSELSRIFNLTDDDTRKMVKEQLNNLKGNIFGLEVDSGKQDIVTGKIGLNLAWSGDAVYSMDQAEDPELVSDPFELYYAIPENGSNIWFDGWAIPLNKARHQETYDLAMAFLDYISDPAVAYLNMEYSGYTSFIGGDSILELVRDWYDIRTDEIYVDVEVEEDNIVSAPIHMVNKDTKEFRMLDYLDFVSSEHDDLLDDYELYYYIPHLIDEESGELIEEAISYEDLMANGDYVYIDENGEMVVGDDTLRVKTYGDLTIVNDPENELEEVDLTYFFNGTTDQYGLADMKFYSDCYLPFSNEDGSDNVSVGRQFFCQYPDEETILRCSVMADYGDDNIKIVKLWEDFKSNPLPVWAIVLLVSEVVVAGLLVAYFFGARYIKKKLRTARKEEAISQKK